MVCERWAFEAVVEGDDACGGGGGAGNEVLMGLELADIILMFCVCFFAA